MELLVLVSVDVAEVDWVDLVTLEDVLLVCEELLIVVLLLD